MDEALIYDNELDATMQATKDNKRHNSKFGKSEVKAVRQVMVWREVEDD
jgi:hypothetical protein